MNFLSQVCYVYDVLVLLAQDDPRWSSMISYDAMLCLLLTSFFVFLFLLKSFILFFLYGHDAQTKIAIVYMREQSCDTRDDMMIPRWYGMYAMEGVDQWSLMCTSNIANNTEMATLDRQVTQNRLGVIEGVLD